MREGRARFLVVVGVLLILVGVGCARTVTPTGGDVPETPMEVVRTSPDTFALVDPFDDPVRFEFDRRPSERPVSGQLRDAVVVSPRTGSVSVRHRRQGLEVRMEGGFSERTVYRITLLPALQDLWQNNLAGPYDLFFSTGPEFEPNVLGGLVTDRLTEGDAPGVRVDAIPRGGEGPTHSTVTDSTGIFTFPFLPADRYMVLAYDDMNRNREADFTEPQDSLEVTVARGDTLIMELALLLPDTTPAVLTGADAVDSLTLRLDFDDPLDPQRSLENVHVRLTREDGAPGPGVVEVLHPHEWEERREAEREEAAPDPDDPPDPDQVADTVPPPDEEEPELVEDPELPEEPEEERLLPGFEVVALLEAPLEPGVVYTVEVEGITNLNEVPGGGGQAEVVGPEPPEEAVEEDPVPEPADTVPVPDTLPPPDTLSTPDTPWLP